MLIIVGKSQNFELFLWRIAPNFILKLSHEKNGLYVGYVG